MIEVIREGDHPGIYIETSKGSVKLHDFMDAETDDLFADMILLYAEQEAEAENQHIFLSDVDDSIAKVKAFRTLLEHFTCWHDRAMLDAKFLKLLKKLKKERKKFKKTSETNTEDF